MKKLLLAAVAGAVVLSALLYWAGTSLGVRQRQAAEPDFLVTRFLSSAPSAARLPPTPPAHKITGPDDAPDTIQLPLTDPFTLEGDIVVGSTESLRDLTALVYEEFVNQGFPGKITQEELWTETALDHFCTSERYDIVGVARPLTSAEVAVCREHGREPVVLLVAQGALIVVVNPGNEFLHDLTDTKLAQLLTAYRWSDLNAAWPAVPIMRYAPPKETDAYRYFVTEFLDGAETALTTAPNTTFSFDFLDLAQAIATDSAALGFLDYSSYRTERADLKPVAIEGILPTDDTLDADYRLRLPLLLYTTPASLQAKPQVAAFLAFYLTYANAFVTAAQQFPLDRAQLEQSKTQLLVALGEKSLLRELGYSPSPPATVSPATVPPAPNLTPQRPAAPTATPVGAHDSEVDTGAEN